MLSSRKIAGTGADDASVGTVSWTNPGNITASDDTRAVATFAGISTTHYLKATNFGFAIPSDARIQGIMVEVERSLSAAVAIRDSAIVMVKGGAIQTATKSRGESWPTSDETVAYGSSRDLWGSAWLPSDINGSTFGVAVSVSKLLGGAADARVDAIWITVYYTRPGVDEGVALVTLRDGRYPHEARIDVRGASLRYGWQVKGTGQASFSIPRSHVQYQAIGDLMYADKDAPPMLTIERDNYLPWVGFVTGFKAGVGDPQVTVRCKDHMVRLKQARTSIATATRPQSSGNLIRSVLSDMSSRGTPPLFIDVASVGEGPGVYYNQTARDGEAFIREMEAATGWEFGFTYQIARDRVETHARWVNQLGTDRRNETVWQDGVHFTERDYDVDFERGYGAALLSVGTGDFVDRTHVEVSISGQNSAGAVGYSRSGRKGYGYGGTIGDERPQLGDAESARRAAQALLDAPENAAEALSFTLVEKAIDRSTLALGDLRTVAFTEFDRQLERVVRIVGMDLNDAGEIGCEVVVET